MFWLGLACGVVLTLCVVAWAACWLFRGDGPIARRIGLWR